MRSRIKASSDGCARPATALLHACLRCTFHADFEPTLAGVSGHEWCKPDLVDPAKKRSEPVLYWAAVFFVIAIVAAIFGFGGIAASATGIAKILFVVFLVLAGLSLLFGRRHVAV